MTLWSMLDSFICVLLPCGIQNAKWCQLAQLSLKNKTTGNDSVCVCEYRGVSVVDDLPHEIGVKHSFSYDGEPCEEVTHAQCPQLLRHLSRTEKKEGIKASRRTWRRNSTTKRLVCSFCKSRHFPWNVVNMMKCNSKIHNNFQFTSP